MTPVDVPICMEAELMNAGKTEGEPAIRVLRLPASARSNHANTAKRETIEPIPLNVDQLVRRCLGSLDLVERLLNSFENRFPVEVAQIEQSLAEGDSQRLICVCHQLKGASANVSAGILNSIMTKMEVAAQENRLQDVIACLGELEAAWEQFKAYKSAEYRPSHSQAVRRGAKNANDRLSLEKTPCAY